MPQMSPLNWLILYFYLILVICLFNMILNFLVLSFKKEKDLNKLILKNYKWYW